jgi:protein-disulfide isomerase
MMRYLRTGSALAPWWPLRPLLVLAIALCAASVVASCGTPQPQTTPSSAQAVGQEDLSKIPPFMIKGQASAPVVLYEWSDYQCPYCAMYANETSPKVDEAYVKTGKIRVVFRDLPLQSIHEHAEQAAEAARCVGTLGGSDAYWKMHDLLFQKQSEWSAEEDPTATLEGYAPAVGVDKAAMSQCLEAGQEQSAVMADAAEAMQIGIQATPSFVLQGSILEGALSFDELKANLDVVVAGGSLPTATVPATPVMVDVAAPTALVEVDDSPTLGDADAKVTIIEFSDYQCPYCKMFYDQTYPTLIKDYVDTGRVRYVFRDLPLSSIHPLAEVAARAAHCAGDQGGNEAYFKMHDALFANQDRWSSPVEVQGPVTATEETQSEEARALPVFAEIATEQGLDGAALTACLQAGTHADQVNQSFEQAVTEFGMGGTPSYVINGYVIAGVMTPEILADYVTKAEQGQPLTMSVPKEYADAMATEAAATAVPTEE